MQQSQQVSSHGKVHLLTRWFLMSMSALPSPHCCSPYYFGWQLTLLEPVWFVPVVVTSHVSIFAILLQSC